MPNPVEIEDIDAMRRRQGIDDVELHEAIRALKVGDFVKLTLLSPSASGETLSVRLTSINGLAFRGKLAERPISSGLSTLPGGLSLTFTAAHIHSLPKERPSHE